MHLCCGLVDNRWGFCILGGSKGTKDASTAFNLFTDHLAQRFAQPATHAPKTRALKPGQTSMQACSSSPGQEDASPPPPPCFLEPPPCLRPPPPCLRPPPPPDFLPGRRRCKPAVPLQ